MLDNVRWYVKSPLGLPKDQLSAFFIIIPSASGRYLHTYLSVRYLLFCHRPFHCRIYILPLSSRPWRLVSIRRIASSIVDVKKRPRTDRSYRTWEQSKRKALDNAIYPLMCPTDVVLSLQSLSGSTSKSLEVFTNRSYLQYLN